MQRELPAELTSVRAHHVGDRVRRHPRRTPDPVSYRGCGNHSYISR
jgi:hypothetical protein